MQERRQGHWGGELEEAERPVAFVCWRVGLLTESSRFRINQGVFNRMAIYKSVGRETYRGMAQHPEGQGERGRSLGWRRVAVWRGLLIQAVTFRRRMSTPCPPP